MTAYYNEIDPYCVQWLRNLIEAGLIAPGHVDDRSILDVTPNDLAGYTQCHFFAGLGGWSGALRLAAWPDNREVWTGSCPCQPFSLAGRQGGFADERHLWPAWFYLVEQRRPSVVLGEQVASASEWLRLVRGDLEALDYAVGCIPMEAASAGAYHKRDRYWLVADDGSGRRAGPGWREGEQPGRAETVGASDSDMGFASSQRRAWFGEESTHCEPGQASEGNWVIGADGKARRVKPGIRLLAHGVPARVAKLRALGNAIDLRPAAAFVKAIA